MKSFVVGLYAGVKVGVYSYLAKAHVCNGAVSLCGSGSVVDLILHFLLCHCVDAIFCAADSRKQLY